MRAWLESSDGSRYEAGNGTKIGRNPKNDIALPSNKVSNQHCGIVETMEDGFQVVEAKATTNGTFVNGSRVQGSASLKNGDTLRIADLEYTFIVDESPLFNRRLLI